MKEQDRIYFGGDYNPDQWDDATVDEDMRLFKLAGVNLVTLPVFSWARLEPDEGVYDFAWLDLLMDKFAANGLRVCLATPTIAQPAWLSTRYPDVLPVDIAGRRRTHGMRVFFCVNSLKYRERAGAIAGEMARRYANHPALAFWHVANEYGTYCYCPQCQAKFRLWLKKRYGTTPALNDRWTTAFWGRTVYSFEEITLPTELNDDYRFNPPIQLDYLRFVSDSTAECFCNERDAIRAHSDAPITTNISGYIKKLNQRVMASEMDVIGWDNYPWPHDEPSFLAFKHDIMRGLKGGAPFYLMEQSPNQQNWQPYNRLKRPGEVRLLSYQAMAHGADSCLFFQMRQSRGGQEKFHGAVIAHAGHEHTRVFRETAALGAELHSLADAFVGGRTPARVAMVFDWENWWALELSSGPSRDMDYLKDAAMYYKAFHSENIAVDVVGADAPLDGYALVVAPMLYMLKPGVAERLRAFVSAGGTLVATTMTGLADENDRCVFGEYPGPLKDMFGIWVEEIDALLPGTQNRMVTEPDARAFLAAEYPCDFLCDVIHTRGAAALARFGEDFYAGMPCVTMNHFGDGEAVYVGTRPDGAFLGDLTRALCERAGIAAPFAAAPGVEIAERVSPAGRTVFVLNHNQEPAWVDFGGEAVRDLLSGGTLTGRMEIAARDCRILKRDAM